MMITSTLVANGATVYITGRDLAKTQAVADEILAQDPKNKAPVHVIKLELLPTTAEI